MRFSRLFVLAGCLVFVASTAFAQDSLLGKKKGGGGGGTSSPPPKSTDSKSDKGQKDKDRGSKSDDSSHASKSDTSSQNTDDQDQSRSNPRYSSPDKDRPAQKQSSRSGRVHYGSQNNLLQKTDNAKTPINIRRAPTRGDLDRDTTAMRDQVRREDRSQVHYRDNDRRDNDRHWDNDDSWFGNGHYRVGYYHYRSNWRDDYFCYPYYVFNPYETSTTCLVSPWYYYSYLPAYVEQDRVVFTSNYESSFVGFPYDYEPIVYNRRDGYDDIRDAQYDNNYVGRRALDLTIDDIVASFVKNDRRAVDHLVPRSGNVLLGVDGSINYGVRADDFYDMMIDATQNSRTVDYQVLAVKANDDEAEVIAEHDYLDSWGRKQVIYHRYHLFGERGNIVIRYFETSTDPSW